jgi:murein L,D-transpeptidase YafK
MMKFVVRFVLLAPILLGLGGCLSFLGFNIGGDSVAPSERQLPATAQALLAIKGMKPESPIFIRIFKEDSELEVWKVKDGRFQHFRTYAICAWSGTLGPKVQQGDRQAPEGFYTIGRSQLNPNSLYHLAFNIGFPNAYDHANGHTGSALMIHGNCKSAGCYAMTDAYIEEIYALAREAFKGGQTKFHVHAYPFRMTADNMQRHRDSPWYPFWAKLKEGYDAFEAAGKPPIVRVCSKQYLVNVRFAGGVDPAPEAPCPHYTKVDPGSLPDIDGVPSTTIMASASKPEPAPRTPAPPVMAASMQPVHDTAQAAPAPAADTSGSGVIARLGPKPAIASLPPKAPASPVYEAPPLVQAAPVQTAPAQTAQVRPSGSAAQPVNFQISVQPTAAQPSPQPAAPGASPADPNALQKLNRSGKGGKLSSPDDGPAAGGWQPQQQPSAAGQR